MSTITKKDIIEKVFKDLYEKRHPDLKQKQVQDVVQELLNSIKDNLAQGNRIEFREFGVFSVHETPERMAQNPATLQKVIVPRRFSVRFKQGLLMKERIRDNKKAEAKPKEQF